MVFVSEREANEYFGRSVNGFENEDGYYEVPDEPKKENLTSSPKHVVYVYCVCNGSKMYVANKGTTFVKAQAKKFAATEGEQKAYWMSKRGYYNWKTEVAG